MAFSKEALEIKISCGSLLKFTGKIVYWACEDQVMASTK